MKNNKYPVINFTSYQLDKFDLITRKSMKESLKSVLSRLYTMNAKMNENEFLDKKYGELTISLSRFLEYYNRATSKLNYHKRELGLKELPLLTLNSLRKRIKKLIELGLIAKLSTGNEESKYIFFATKEQFIEHTKEHSKNVDETIENTSVEADEEIRSNTLPINKTIDIDSNRTDSSSAYETENNKYQLSYTEYIAQERKVESIDVLTSAIDRVFKALKVRSSWIKTTVIEKLCKYYPRISVKHLDSYICKCVMNARAKHEASFKKNVLGIQQNNNHRNFGPDEAIVQKRLDYIHSLGLE